MFPRPYLTGNVILIVFFSEKAWGGHHNTNINYARRDNIGRGGSGEVRHNPLVKRWINNVFVDQVGHPLRYIAVICDLSRILSYELHPSYLCFSVFTVDE